VTKGLSSRFPDRVISMPISEASIVGFATGTAMRGSPTIAEIMFGDFMSLTMDQLLNPASKMEWMYNGTVRVPLIVRTPMGGGRGYGPTHSQSLEKHFCGIPGLSVFAIHEYTAPSELLFRAYRLRQPCLLIENKLLYPRLVKAPDCLPKYESPDILLVSYGAGVELCRATAMRLHNEEEIDAEVIAITWIRREDAVSGLKGLQSGGPGEYRFCEAFYHR